MALQRQPNLNEAEDWFIRLSRKIEANASLRHLDAHTEVEPFFRDLLNLLFGWTLRSSNWAGPVSYTHLDVYKRQGVFVDAASMGGI